MNYKYKAWSIITTALVGILFLSCNKTQFLNTIPNSNIVVPTTVTDFQALLDNTNVFGIDPIIGEESADNYYRTYTFWQSLSPTWHQTVYTWASDEFQGQGGIPDWNDPYQQVFYTNIVLDNINSIAPTSSNTAQLNSIKGSAHFLRAWAFYNIASLFAPPYDSISSSSDLGIIVKTSSDINTNPGRSSVQASYDAIISDVNAALWLLPATVPTSNLNRPSKPSAYAFLSRVYLSMRKYHQARLYADSSLQLYNKLLNFNTISSPTTPFTTLGNVETIYMANIYFYTGLYRKSSYAIVDSTLFGSYNSNDLRRTVFLTTVSGIARIGYAYTGNAYLFSGIAMDEVYLNRAEGAARDGDMQSAMLDLNTLLVNRYKTNTFTPLVAVSAQDALDQILVERRKETAFRGLRWTDLRRLNKDGANITLTRVLNGTMYTLSPNSPLYVFPIPIDEISQSTIQQNPR
jgi:hypothetical protein